MENKFNNQNTNYNNPPMNGNYYQPQQNPNYQPNDYQPNPMPNNYSTPPQMQNPQFSQPINQQCENMDNSRQANRNENPYSSYVQNNGNGKKPKAKKVKKKKKHRFLKFLLFNIILICAIVFGSKFLNNLAQKQLEKMAKPYPFTFENEIDTPYYVTGDFDVPILYEHNDKKYNVKWETSNEDYISFDEKGNAIVQRPKDRSVDVVVTQVYKKFLGKGTINYTLTLIPTNTITLENVDVVTLDELKNQTYTNEMEAMLLDNGDVRYMYGDFDNTYVHSMEDALVILEGYREQLGISPSFTFELNTINSSLTSTSYIFNVYYNDILLNNETVQIIVDKNNELMKILNGITTDENDITTSSSSIDYNTIISNYLKENVSNEEFVFEEDKTILKDGALSKSYFVVLKDGSLYYMTINQNTGDVLSFVDLYNRSQIIPLYFNQDCEGIDEKENNHKFVASLDFNNFWGNKYVLYDNSRNIAMYENKEYWDVVWESLKNNSDRKNSIIDFLLNGSSNIMISSKTNTFNNPIAVQSYITLQNTYDWYNNKFNWNSYNGKGGKLVVKVDYDNGTDNASWVNILHYFCIYPNGNLKYSTTNTPEVLAHEYTHAVFEAKGGFHTDGGYELSGINEAYADVMGILSSNKTNWLVGENETTEGEYVYFRDIKNINSEHIYSGNLYPTTYKGENWEEEEHCVSVVLSHIAYEMTEDELFSWDDVAKIWYESMSYGYDANSTFVDARKNLIQAADKLGYSKEHQDFIAYYCDLAEIFDPSYTITTERFLENDIEDNEEIAENILKTKSFAISGHQFLDDDASSTFLIATSPIGMFFGETPIMIYQLENGASKEEIEEMEKQLTVAINNYFNKDTDLNLQIEVIYDQLPPTSFSILKKILNDTDNYMKEITFSSIGVTNESELDSETSSFINGILKLVFYYDMTNCTAYDFYDGLGITEDLQ